MKSRPLLLTALLLAPLSVFLLGQSTPPEPTTISADKSEVWTKDDIAYATFDGHVVVTGTNLKITCDHIETVADNLAEKGSTIPTVKRFRSLIATGNVHIVQGNRTATAGRAEVLPREEIVVLTENPQVADSDTGMVTAAEKMEFLRGEQRIRFTNIRMTAPAIPDLGADARKYLGGDAAAPASPSPAPAKP